MREKKQAKEKAPFKKKAGKRGITQKLTGTIILTIAVMVAVLLLVVYNRVSSALLEKAKNFLQRLPTKQSRKQAHG